MNTMTGLRVPVRCPANLQASSYQTYKTGDRSGPAAREEKRAETASVC